METGQLPTALSPTDRITSARAFAQWIGPALLAVQFAALTAWSWRKWPDLLVDFGQQLYIPWRLASGDILYRDIAWLHGPLSQHLNGALFALFGPSLTTLIVANLALLALLIGLVYRLALDSTDRLTAFITCATLIGVFAFGQYVRVGNYNFISPYTHEATHGVILVALMILLLDRHARRKTRGTAAAAGLCLGLVLLTKADVALAAGTTAVLAWLLVFTRDRSGSLKEKMRGAGLFALASVAPGAAFFTFFASVMPAGQALRASAGAFASIRPEIAANAFYGAALGLDRPGANSARMIWMGSLVLLFVALAAGLDLATRRFGARRIAIGATLGATLLLVSARAAPVPWQELPRMLPLAMLLITVGLLVTRLRQREPDTPTAPLLCAAFALMLLMKIVLNTHLYHFGFYLAMPAALLMVAALVHRIPRALARRHGGHGIVFRLLAAGLLCGGILFHLRWAGELYAMKSLPVGNGGDRIMTYDNRQRPHGKAVTTALEWIERRMPEDATFVALPEGVMLNYLSRRIWPARCINFMMTEMLVFGEEALLAQLEENPPDYVLLVHKETREFGVGYFGSDPLYGRSILEWIELRYMPFGVIGSPPLTDGRFGISVYTRRPDVAPAQGKAPHAPLP